MTTANKTDAQRRADQISAFNQELAELARAQALIRPRWNSYQGKQQWEGSIDDLLIDRINIPLNQRALFTPREVDLRSDLQDDKLPRYSVRIAFGKRAEPWVIGVGKM